MQQQQQQQQLMHMHMQQPIMAAPLNTTAITTDHIQQYLDENKSLILKILENQNSGKHGECAENQARLQRNLTYLAAIADCQPQPSSIYAQPSMNYLQHQQSQQMVSQSLMAARSPMLYAQQQPYSALQQQQALHSQIAIGSAVISGTPTQQSEETGVGGGGTKGFPDFGRSTTGEGLQGGTRVAGGSRNEENDNPGSAEDQGCNSQKQSAGNSETL